MVVGAALTFIPMFFLVPGTGWDNAVQSTLIIIGVLMFVIGFLKAISGPTHTPRGFDVVLPPDDTAHR
jgi:hypothetical protein